MADKIKAPAKEQNGYLGMESSSTEIGITMSYWKDEISILKWKQHAEHLIAQQHVRDKWYAAYLTRICKVERDYSYLFMTPARQQILKRV